jgi:hypothetical protein
VPSIHSVIGSGRRLLARHLTRLSDTLETFGARLREAVSSAVGETVSGIVRETVRAVLAEQPAFATSPERFVPSGHHPRPLWAREDDPGEEPWYDDPYGDPRDEDHDDAPPAPRADGTPAPSRLPRALAVGFHTTICWLRRSVGRFPVLTAVAVGLLTALATYAGGPLAAAAVALAGSAFNLLSLAEAVDTGADTLAAFGCP